MTIGDIMRGFWQGEGKNAAQVQQMQQTQPTMATSPQTPSSTASPPSDGSVAAFPATATGDKSPLSGFDKLWETDPNRKPLAHAIGVTLDEKKIDTAIGQIDYTKALPPELLAKATGGDSAALLDVINRTSQAATANATKVATSIVNEALDRQATHYKDNVIPEVLRANAVRQAIHADNPIFDNPAVKPMLEMAENQLIQKFPQASAAEINAMAKDLTKEFAQAVVSAQGKDIVDRPVVRESDKPFDWEGWATKPTA